MGLREVPWKFVYRTGDDDLLNDFYLPALSHSVVYSRAVGFYSSHILAAAAEGVSALIRNDGKMRLIIGAPLDEDEYQAVLDGKLLADLGIDLSEKFLDYLSKPVSSVQSYRFQLLAWLIASGRLEIRFAFRRRGMYHEKIGILEDENHDRIIFQGSANESVNALLDLNAEAISVYPSWEAVYDTHGSDFEKAFNQVWDNQHLNTICMPLPSQEYEKIAAAAHSRGVPNLDAEVDLSNEEPLSFDIALIHGKPEIPKTLHGSGFEIKDHQRRALEAWRANQYRGILKLATGAGKTITAIYGAVKMFEASGRLALIIAVPYVELATQWVDNLRIFRIGAHKCYTARGSWHPRFAEEVRAFKSQSINFVCAVVVNATLRSDSFLELMSQLPKTRLLFVGDECHHHGGDTIHEVLPDCAWRMGLSATPFRSEDDEFESPFPSHAADRIRGYYGEIVAEYSLGDAINDDILTPYDYHVHFAYLESEEQDEYLEVSAEIGQMLGKRSLTEKDRRTLTFLFGRRSRLVGSAAAKFALIERLASDVPKIERAHSLFYCAEGFYEDEDSASVRQVSRVSRILADCGWRTAQFTSKESKAKRVGILEAFREGTIEGLVSMRVLDEGIDIPACRTAYVLASTRNPRQYIQRRGRILRRYPGKNVSTIHDFLVLPNPAFNAESSSKRLIEHELERAFDFLELARNKVQTIEALENEGLI